MPKMLEHIRPLLGLTVANRLDGVFTGEVIDTRGFFGGMSITTLNGITGSPTGLQVTHELEGSKDGQGGWIPLIFNPSLPVWNVASMSNAEMLTHDFHISESIIVNNVYYRFIREKLTILFAGGTTPAVDIGSIIILGDPDELPVTAVA